MTELISYEELRKIQNAERNNVALQKLEPDFFVNVKEYIKSKNSLIEENKGKDNTFSQQTVEKGKEELKNISKILDDICARRQKKIVMQAMTNITARVHNTEMMLPEEEYIYNKMIAIIKAGKDSFAAKFTDEEVKPELKKEEKDLVLIRVLDEVPSFVWKDSKTYGPFQKEDVANLPKDVGEILINQGKASEIQES